MDFGRLPSVDDVDFRLPEEPADQLLPGPPADGVLLVGLPGWADGSFRGALYPKGTTSGGLLAHYGRVFPTNELNSTFYGVDRDRIVRWAAEVPDHFRFCPKLPREITHDRSLAGADAAMQRFVSALDGFGAKIGRVWGTLAPSFGPDRLPVLDAFLRAWAPRVPLAFELRHHAWFADAGARDDVFGCFTEHGVTAILTDVAGRRDVLHMRVCAPDVMLRFVGNALHPSDFTRLDAWVPRLADWRARGLARAFVFLHQKHEVQSLDLARHFDKVFAAHTGVTLLPDLPAPLPTQGELF